MRGNLNYLFDGSPTHAVAQTIAKNAMEEVHGYDEDTILGKSIDDLVDALVEKYKLEIPVLHIADTYIDQDEQRREERFSDDYGWGRGGTRTVIESVITFHVPITGDAGLFSCSPSSRTIPGPCALVGIGELQIAVKADGATQEAIRARFDDVVRSIEAHLVTMRRDLGNLAGQFQSPAHSFLTQRREAILKNKNLASDLGFPMKRRDGAPSTYRAPEVRRKLAPTRPTTVAPFKPEPTLDLAEYTHILNIMDNMTKVMERSPHVFHKMGEEDIRQHFLVQLNAQYDGQATGETFNAGGKTDILIRSEGHNIFVAECKFWHGEKGFVETVDQLLGYVTWRDTKTAIVIFNRNKKLSGNSPNLSRKQWILRDRRSRGPLIEGRYATSLYPREPERS